VVVGLTGTAAGLAGDFVGSEAGFDGSVDRAAFDPAEFTEPLPAPASPDSTTGLAVAVFAGANLIAGDFGCGDLAGG
jgi:hypothetical protein